VIRRRKIGTVGVKEEKARKGRKGVSTLYTEFICAEFSSRLKPLLRFTHQDTRGRNPFIRITNADESLYDMSLHFPRAGA